MSQKLVPFIDDSGKNHWPIHIDPASGILYYLKKHSGRNIKFTTGCTRDQLLKAKRVANDRLAAKLGTKKTAAVTPTVGDEIEPFLKFKEGENLDLGTMVRIRSTLKHKITPFWKNKLVSEINDDTVAEWIAWYKAKWPRQTMDNAVKYLRNFCNYESRKVVRGLPLLPVVPVIRDPDQKAVKKARKQKTERIFTADEFKQVFNAGNETEKLAALFMYTMATRIEETMTLRFGHELFLSDDPPIYRWSEGQNKADHEGFHALHPALVPLLEAVQEKRAAEGGILVFPQLRDRTKALKPAQINWDDWRKRANIGWHWTSKTFRHTCLSNLFGDARNPHAMIMKLYRVSLRVALDTYIKPPPDAILKMRTAIEVNL